MSTGGIALAVSGSSSSGSAASGEYAPPSGPPAGPPEQVVTTVQAPSSLPFTGYAAITLIVIGVGLATTGLVVRYVVTRRRSSGL